MSFYGKPRPRAELERTLEVSTDCVRRSRQRVHGPSIALSTRTPVALPERRVDLAARRIARRVADVGQPQSMTFSQTAPIDAREPHRMVRGHGIEDHVRRRTPSAPIVLVQPRPRSTPGRRVVSGRAHAAATPRRPSSTQIDLASSLPRP